MQRERDPDEERDMRRELARGFEDDRAEARAAERARVTDAEEGYAARFEAPERWVY